MRFAVTLFSLSMLVALQACRNDEGESVESSPAAQSAALSADVAPANLQPTVVVHKSESCGCCRKWVEHMQTHGFPVKINNTEDLGPVKERVGVPYGMGSCHTAEVGGYFIEGHVPATEVQRLLAERPDAKGLVVPGMPIGSPGMEQGEQVDHYDVYLVHRDGTTSVFASY